MLWSLLRPFVWVTGGGIVVFVLVLIFGPGPGLDCRYRLTLEVETPEGTKTGTGVIQTIWKRSAIPGAALMPESHGQAVMVDLGARGVLFATLVDRSQGLGGSPSNRSSLPLNVLHARKLIDWGAAMFSQMESIKARFTLKVEEIPLLVRFRDLDSPDSVEPVDPDDFSARFGPGVRLKSAIFETTRDPVTTGIEKTLPWVSSSTMSQLGGLSGKSWKTSNPTANSLGGAAFLQ
jgi:hypothetical protein